MSSAKTWLLNGALLLAASALALALAEGAVRMLAPQPFGLAHQDRYGLAMHWPGVTRYLSQYGHEVTFNAAGMRDRAHTVEKAAGTTRILLLGDSFIEALQVPFEDSLPSLLERTLAERTGKPVEVVSAGVSGWGQDDELRYLTRYGLAYQPDVVIVAMTLHNDVSDNLEQEWYTTRDGVLVEQPRLPLPFWKYKELQLKAVLASRLQLYQLLRRVRLQNEIQEIGRQLDEHVAQLFQVPTPDGIALGIDLTAQLLAGIQGASSEASAHVVVVELPIRYQLSDESFAEFAHKAGIPLEAMEIDAPQRMIGAVTARLGLQTVDLLPGFRKRAAESGAPLYLEWDGHWNEAGHRLANEIVAAQLLESGAVH